MKKTTKQVLLILLVLASIVFVVTLCACDIFEGRKEKLTLVYDHNHIVRENDDIDSIRPYLTVNYMDENGNSSVVTAYTLSGNFEEGVCVVTVMYQNLTATCQIVVTSGDQKSTIRYILEADGKSYTVTGCGETTNKNVIIPSIYRGKPVTGIASNAFRESKFTNIVIPDSITSIGSRAFDCCDKLQYNEYDNALYLGNDTNKYVALIKAKSKDITTCKINENAKVIYDDAFLDCSNLTSILIPNNVTDIGWRAFNGCNNLKDITIGKNVMNIQGTIFSDAFSSCGNLTNIDYLGTIESWCKIEGLNCLMSAGENIRFSLNGDEVKELVIPDSVTCIPVGAFKNCNNITSVTIGKNLAKISGLAFDYCSFMKRINYSGSMKSWCEIEGLENLTSCGVDNKVFCLNGEEVKDLVIPTGTTSIPSDAFRTFGNIESITIENGATSIGADAFYNCSGLTNISIPDSITSIGIRAFDGCNKLQYNEYSNALYLGNDDNNYAVLIKAKTQDIVFCRINENTKIINNNAFQNCSDLVNITIPNKVTTINYQAFYNCRNLKSIQIGDSVTYIDSEAFAACSTLEEIKIPDGVTRIGRGVFGGCRSLISVSIPNSIMHIDPTAFEGCGQLKYNEYDNALYLGNDTNKYVVLVAAKSSGADACLINEQTKVINAYAFSKRNNLTNVIIPNGVRIIDGNAFYQCNNLTSVIIPDSVVSIGESAFRECGNLTRVMIGNNVTEIARGVFSDCTRLTNITIGKSVTNISSSAFSGADFITSIDYLGTIESWCQIEGLNYLMEGHDKKLSLNGQEVRELIIPDTVTVIASGAFRNCGNIVSLTLGKNVASINDHAFDDCGISSLVLSDSVKIIGDFAFAWCDELTNVNIPVSVTSIGYSAFFGCRNLTSVYYQGDSSDWKKINRGGDDFPNTSTRYYYSENEPSLNVLLTAYDDNYWHYVDGVVTVWKKN